jgi:hypothetical protein
MYIQATEVRGEAALEVLQLLKAKVPLARVTKVVLPMEVAVEVPVLRAVAVTVESEWNPVLPVCQFIMPVAVAVVSTLELAVLAAAAVYPTVIS